MHDLEATDTQAKPIHPCDVRIAATSRDFFADIMSDDAKDDSCSARGSWSPARDFAAGWCGGASGILASHPLDTARVRIQVGDTTGSIVKELASMLRHEGVQSLGRGYAYWGSNSGLALFHCAY